MKKFLMLGVLMLLVSSIFAAGSITITKTSNVAHVSPGTTYTISVNCTGNCYDVSIWDTAPTGFTWVSSDPTPVVNSSVRSWAYTGLTNTTLVIDAIGYIGGVYSPVNITNVANVKGSNFTYTSASVVIDENSPTSTITPTFTITNTITKTATPTITPSNTTISTLVPAYKTQTAIVNAVLTLTAEALLTQEITYTFTSTITPTITQTTVTTPTFTQTADVRTNLVKTQTAVANAKQTWTAIANFTETFTKTATDTPVDTLTPTLTPTSTASPTVGLTFTSFGTNSVSMVWSAPKFCVGGRVLIDATPVSDFRFNRSAVSNITKTANINPGKNSITVQSLRYNTAFGVGTVKTSTSAAAVIYNITNIDPIAALNKLNTAGLLVTEIATTSAITTGASHVTRYATDQVFFTVSQTGASATRFELWSGGTNLGGGSQISMSSYPANLVGTITAPGNAIVIPAETWIKVSQAATSSDAKTVQIIRCALTDYAKLKP
jgi:hypothetical protein